MAPKRRQSPDPAAEIERSADRDLLIDYDYVRDQQGKWDRLAPQLGEVSTATGRLEWQCRRSRLLPDLLAAHEQVIAAVRARSAEGTTAMYAIAEMLARTVVVFEQQDRFQARLIAGAQDRLGIDRDRVSSIASGNQPDQSAAAHFQEVLGQVRAAPRATADQRMDQISARYQQLRGQVDWLNGAGRQQIMACSGGYWDGPARSLTDRAVGALREAQAFVEEVLADLGFPDIGRRDAGTWAAMSAAAQRVGTGLTAEAMLGRVYATWGDDTSPLRYPWSGLAGQAYRRQVPPQRDATNRLGTVCGKAGEAMSAAARNAGYLVSALEALLGILVAALVAFGRTLAALAGAAVAALALGPMLIAALVALVTAVVAGVVAYHAIRAAFDLLTGEQASQLRSLLTAVDPALRLVGGRWPDPTGDSRYPHAVRDAGAWRISAMPAPPATPPPKATPPPRSTPPPKRRP